jgi:hypothetical protein
MLISTVSRGKTMLSYHHEPPQTAASVVPSSGATQNDMFYIVFNFSIKIILLIPLPCCKTIPDKVKIVSQKLP